MKKPNLNLKRASLLTSSLLCSALLIAVPLRKELNEGWKFKQARLSNWYPATVPGVVHTDLMDNKIIEDPFFRLNERGMQWIDKEDWIYQTTFQLTPEMMGRENIDLIFKGLDTYADVYLNEKKILEANNMFREWKTSIKPDLKPGENVLKIYFHSPIKVDIPKWDALPYQYEAGNDQSENGGVFNKKVSVFARKAGYHYGWDWGPRLVTSGIWRPVYVEAWDNARINDVFIRQPEVSKSRASLIGEVEILADKEIDQANVTITEAASGRVLAGQTVSLQKGINKISLPFSIKSPKLWWSNGLGEPHLYSFRTDLTVNNQTSDAWTEEVGLRSLKIINRPDKDGKTFYVELNGIPVFAKGANYIPQDNFLPRVTPGQYEKTILDAANANMNMLRIWGGGTYESDLFYQLCDRYGILVWQDFMFACSLYPAEGELLENIRQEAIDNVKRLRNHACIALWCGNNECNDAWFNWGWQKRYKAQNPEYEQKIWKQFNDQYNVTLPQVVEEYAPESFYWPSSPFARYDGGSDDRNGRHYWEVWHGKKPIEMYNKERSRFFSEYGFQSFPEFESVKRYAPRQEDWDIYSEVMMSHQRGGMHANELIETYLLNEYRKPRNFEAFLYMNHVLQGDAIKTAIEAHRRDMPYCMGTLFWQHNDCWPVASWASRDYYGRWKAQHYFARKAYRDILVSPIADEDGQLKVQIVSDRHKACNGRLEVKVMKLTGEVLNSYKRNVIVDANSSKALFSVPLDEALKGVRKEDVFIHAVLLTDKGNSNYTNNYFLVKQKEVNYPKAQLATSVQPIEGGFEVTLSSDNFARAVFIATGDANSSFSDNYFDILPGSSVKVEVYTDLPLATFEKQLKVVSLSDEY